MTMHLEAVTAAAQLHARIDDARRAGYSWPAIAAAVSEGRGRIIGPDALAREHTRATRKAPAGYSLEQASVLLGRHRDTLRARAKKAIAAGDERVRISTGPSGRPAYRVLDLDALEDERD